MRRGAGLAHAADRLLGCTFTPAHSRVPRTPFGDRLAVLSFGALGDSVLQVRALHRAGVDPSAVRAILSPSAHRTWAALGFEVPTFELAAGPSTPTTWLRHGRNWLRSEGVGAIVDLERWMHLSAWVCRTSAVPSVGHSRPAWRRQYAYTHPRHLPHMHVIDQYTALIRDGVELAGTPRRPPEDWRPVPRPSQPLPLSEYVVAHVGAGANPEHARRRIWSPERWAQVLSRLLTTHPPLGLVFTGTRHEQPLVAATVEALQQSFPGVADRVVTVADLPLGHLLSLLEGARAVLCVNTGVMHLADALGVPTVALHGPTDPALWGPTRPTSRVVMSPKWCAPCLDLGHDYGRNCACMGAIEVERVVAVAESLLRAEREAAVVRSRAAKGGRVG